MTQQIAAATVPGLEPQRAFLRRLTAATGGGMFLDGFVFATIAAVIAGTAFSKELGLTPVTLGLISSATLVGTMIGGPLIGYLTDVVGRKPMFIVDLCIFLAASLAMFIVTEPWQIIALGVILGMAIGGDYAIGSPLLGEFAPVRNRGRYLAVLEILWNVGYVTAFFVGLVVLSLAPEAWRFVLASSAIPAGVILMLRHGLPESPRWLIGKGRRAEAEKVLADLGVDPERAGYLEEPETKTRWRTLFSRAYIGRTAFASLFWVCIVIPYFALTFFQSEVLATLGIDNPVVVALLGTMVALLGAATGWYLIDKVGRRPLLIIPMFVCGAALTVVALGDLLAFPVALNVVCFFAYLFFYGIMGILCGVYPLEVFPTSVRTSGLGLASGFSRVGAAVATFLVPIGFATLGLVPVVLILAGVSVFGGVISLILAPETARKHLTDTGAISLVDAKRIGDAA
jgi:MFS transporter, putative metabolite transport protein